MFFALVVVLEQEGEQSGDGEAALRRMAETGVRLDAVRVAPALAGVGEIPLGLQVGDDLLDRPLGEPAARRDVADAGGPVLRDGDQHAGVIGEKRPTGVWLRCLSCLPHAPRLDVLFAHPED